MGTPPLPPPPSVNIDLLLRQTGWVRRLARRLIDDGAHAEDLAQEAMLAVLRAPPVGASNERILRAWLARVLRNCARLAVRTNLRRQRREEIVARSEVEEATAEVVERASQMRLVVEAVFELPEPYRSTVLLRYFDDLSTAEIAEKLGISQEAVRKRLSRSFARLRVRLDSEHGSDRRAWVLAFHSWASPRSLEALPKTLPLVGSGLVAVLVLLVLGAAWLWISADQGAGASSARPEVVPISSKPLPKLPVAAASVDRMEAEPRVASMPDPVPPPVPGRLLTGQVIDLAGQSVPGVALRFQRIPWLVESFEPVALVSDEQGHFEIRHAAHEGQVVADSPDYTTVYSGDIGAFREDRPCVVVVARRFEISGKVVDQAGRAVAQAFVELAPSEVHRNQLPVALYNSRYRRQVERTDTEGHFSFPDAPRIEGASLWVDGSGY